MRRRVGTACFHAGGRGRTAAQCGLTESDGASGSGVKNRRMHEVTLSDEVITLSPLRPDDVRLTSRGGEPLARWLNGGRSTREGVAAYFRHCQEQWGTAGPLRAFGIRAGAGVVLAGTIDLRFEGEGSAPGQVNVTYGLCPSWRGCGRATRAVLLVSQYVSIEGGEEAVIQVEPENPGSVAVARRAGFIPDRRPLLWRCHRDPGGRRCALRDPRPRDRAAHVRRGPHRVR